MEPKELLEFLRQQAKMWAREDVPANAFLEATVVAVQGTTARIQRPGFDADSQFYPTLAPYSPVPGDQVMCAVTATGLYIQGAINRGGTTDAHTGNFAPLKDPDLLGTPTAPTAPTDNQSEHIATTAFVKEVLAANPVLGGTPTATTDGSNTNSTRIPTQAWVNTFFAPIASPTFTGTPVGTTDGSNTNSTRIPTQAWVNTFFANSYTSATGSSTTFTTANTTYDITSASVSLNPGTYVILGQANLVNGSGGVGSAVLKIRDGSGTLMYGGSGTTLVASGAMDFAIMAVVVNSTGGAVTYKLSGVCTQNNGAANSGASIIAVRLY